MEILKIAGFCRLILYILLIITQETNSKNVSTLPRKDATNITCRNFVERMNLEKLTVAGSPLG